MPGIEAKVTARKALSAMADAYKARARQVGQERRAGRVSAGQSAGGGCRR